jgi:hypothetical protein
LSYSDVTGTQTFLFCGEDKPMSGFELRPLSLGELLDRAFFLYRRNFWLFAGIMVIPSCLILPMQYLGFRRRGMQFPWNRPSPQPHDLAYTFGFLFLYWIVYAVAEAATTYAVAEEYLGRHSTIREAYGRLRGRFWVAIGVTLNVYIRTLVLIFIFVALAVGAGATLAAALNQASVSAKPTIALIPIALTIGGFALGLLFSARYTLSLPAVLLEDIKGRAAIRRSVRLSRGRRGQLFVAILLGIVVSYAAAAMFQGPFYLGIAVMGIKGHIPSRLILALSVSDMIGHTIAAPLLMIVLVLFYYDLRIRKEGFDLQHMMTSLPEPNPASSNSPA